jgi:hypothetical protein
MDRTQNRSQPQKVERALETHQEIPMANKQAPQRSKSGNSSGSRVKEATGGLKHPTGWSGGKHPKNKVFVGGVPPTLKRHPDAKV